MSATNKSASEHSRELSLSELDQVAGGIFDFSGVGTAAQRAVNLTGAASQSGGDGGGASDPIQQRFQELLQNGAVSG
jgi:hypothetical protein